MFWIIRWVSLNLLFSPIPPPTTKKISRTWLTSLYRIICRFFRWIELLFSKNVIYADFFCAFFPRIEMCLFRIYTESETLEIFQRNLIQFEARQKWKEIKLSRGQFEDKVSKWNLEIVLLFFLLIISWKLAQYNSRKKQAEICKT